jgi:hypothetical protein
LATDGRERVGGRPRIPITISVTTDTKAVDADQQFILNVIILKVYPPDIPPRDGQHNVAWTLRDGKRSVRAATTKLCWNVNIRKGINRRTVDAIDWTNICDRNDPVVGSVV